MNTQLRTALAVVALAGLGLGVAVEAPKVLDAADLSADVDALAAKTKRAVRLVDAGRDAPDLQVRMYRVEKGVLSDGIIFAAEVETDAGVELVAYPESPCVIPDCSSSDGGWDDNGPQVDCLPSGPYGLPDGGPRWGGCNVMPRAYAVGTACLPSACAHDRGT